MRPCASAGRWRASTCATSRAFLASLGLAYSGGFTRRAGRTKTAGKPAAIWGPAGRRTTMTPETLFDAERLLGDAPWPHGPLDAFLVRWWAGQHPGPVEDRARAGPLLAERRSAAGLCLWLVSAA